MVVLVAVVVVELVDQMPLVLATLQPHLQRVVMAHQPHPDKATTEGLDQT
jgi:hypothetical protein